MKIARDTDRIGHAHYHHRSFSALGSDRRKLSTGLHSIRYGNGNLDILLLNNSASTTFVCFHAAMNPSNITVPVFAGLNFTRGLDANFLFISDPSLEKGIGLGWFAGDRERKLQSDLPAIIEIFLTAIPAHRNLVFFGPSGGGFAALYYSYQFSGSLAVPVNPQTNIKRYNEKFVREYFSACWPGGPSVQDFPTYNCCDLYKSDVGSDVLYLQNVGDTVHIDDQLLPFVGASIDEPRWLGILFGHWGVGHAPAPAALLRNVFYNAIKADGQWENLFAILGVCRSPSIGQVESARDGFYRL